MREYGHGESISLYKYKECSLSAPPSRRHTRSYIYKLLFNVRCASAAAAAVRSDQRRLFVAI